MLLAASSRAFNLPWHPHYLCWKHDWKYLKFPGSDSFVAVPEKDPEYSCWLRHV